MGLYNFVRGFEGDNSRAILPISESHLSQYLKFQWDNKAKEDYKPEKKVSNLHWPRTDSVHINCKCVCKVVQHFKNASFSYV